MKLGVVVIAHTKTICWTAVIVDSNGNAKFRGFEGKSPKRGGDIYAWGHEAGEAMS